MDGMVFLSLPATTLWHERKIWWWYIMMAFIWKSVLFICYIRNIQSFEMNKLEGKINYVIDDISIDFENVYVRNAFNEGINYIVITADIYDIE